MSTAEVAERSPELALTWAGIDVSNAKFDAAIYPPPPPGKRCWTMQQIQVRTFEMTRQGVAGFAKWAMTRAGQPGQLRIAMEATGKCSLRLAAMLVQVAPAVKVSICNPLFIKRFGGSLGIRNKTDGLDARVIARFGAEREPEPWVQPNKAMQHLRDLVRERQAIVESITEHKHRAREYADNKLIHKVQLDIIKCLDKQLAKIEGAIKELIEAETKLKADVELLDSVVGVGLITAVTVLVELGDLRRFDTARGLAAFTGVSPQERTSGTTVHGKTRMCKIGSQRARRVLHMAAVATLKNENRFHRFYEQLRARGKTHGQALGAIMRKLLLVMRAVLRTNQPYIDTHSPVEKPTRTKGEIYCAA